MVRDAARRAVRAQKQVIDAEALMAALQALPSADGGKKRIGFA